MKHTLFLFAFLCSLYASVHAQQGPRKILWLNGPSGTSDQWTRAQTSATQSGYQYTSINDWPYNNNTIANNIPDWASFFNQKLETGEHTDVVGIGHDAGGLILRYMGMTQQDNRLSAMILDGVPNQGGRVFTKLLPINAGFPSGAQKVAQDLLDLRTQAQGCMGCRMIEATQRWFDGFSHPAVKTYYEDIKPQSSIITNLVPPNIPYAVIWGNEDDADALTLTRVIGSWHNSGLFGEDNEYLDCYRKELDQRVKDAKDNFLIGMLRSVATYAGAASRIQGSPANIGSYLEATLNALASAIRTQKDLAKEMREMFECELIHQALNAKWNLLVSDYTTVQETITTEVDCCADCYDEPDSQVQSYCFMQCFSAVDPCVNTYTYSYAVFEPHDGLLTRTEQLLAGAEKTYEAKRCNHFQEQFWQYPPIANAFNDLFMGGAGAAFVVPK
jgi:pimeloyl-ACP methyl ester carboxylesterase